MAGYARSNHNHQVSLLTSSHTFVLSRINTSSGIDPYLLAEREPVTSPWPQMVSMTRWSHPARLLSS
jgi:hypothetical protein